MIKKDFYITIEYHRYIKKYLFDFVLIINIQIFIISFKEAIKFLKYISK